MQVDQIIQQYGANKVLWLCEKPSQGRDIAAVLGGNRRGDGCIATSKGIVTWGFGHLLQQAMPEHYDAELKKWNIDSLPIIPSQWTMLSCKKSVAQLNIIKKILSKVSCVVIATDADREGEAIGRELLDYCDYSADINRLWLSALDAVSIGKALGNIKAGEETKSLYDAALARSRADWLVGVNLTRAATIAYSNEGVLSVGRVQTPTLALIVRRDNEIDGFKPRNYYDLQAKVEVASGIIDLMYSPRGDEERIFDKAVAYAKAELTKNTKSGTLIVKTIRKKQSPPPLFSLASLQKVGNAKFGWSADQTLKIAQALYETHKATSYPRSDCAFLPEEQIVDVAKILKKLQEVDVLANYIPALPQIRKTVFNSSKITAHHAIIPTTSKPNMAKMNDDERKAYILIASHYIACLMPDYIYDASTISLVINIANGIDLPYSQSGKMTVDSGWRALLGNDSDKALPSVSDGETGNILDVKLVTRKTKAPSYYTEGNLISDMASIAKFVTEPKLKARLKETSGIGTEATRAGVIETLKQRGYVVVKGKQITSTPVAKNLIKVLPPSLSDPGVTAMWEDALEAIVAGRQTEQRFVKGIAIQVGKLIPAMATAAARKPRTPRSNNGKPRNNKPTPKMLEYAKSIAKGKNVRLPRAASTSFDICKKFLDTHRGKKA
ncbi:MAG: DNA topoisomerase 3 [Mariprofundales bacterium]